MKSVAGLGRDEAVAALEANLWSMWSAFGRGDGCVLVDTPEVLRFETPIRHVPYNMVLRFRPHVDGAALDQLIDEVLGAYTSRHVPLVWLVHPTSLPADIDVLLEKRGLQEAEVCPGMVARIDEIPPPEPFPDGVVVEPFVADARDEFIDIISWRYSLPPDARETLASVMDTRGFGRPDCPTEAWVARIDGRIVSKVVLHFDEGIAGLYGVATRAEARGMGLARNLTAYAFARARSGGYALGVLHSTPMAHNLYRGLGFHDVAPFRLFGDPATLHL